MMKKFPATFEPVMIVLPHPDSHQLAALDEVLKRLKAERLIETSSSPSALVLDPARMRANEEMRARRDLTASARRWSRLADPGCRPSPLSTRRSTSSMVFGEVTTRSS